VRFIRDWFHRPAYQLGSLLLFAIALEAALMGSGRILTVGPLTVKMLLFLMSMGFTGAALMLGLGLSVETYFIVISFGFIACFGLLIGLLHGATSELFMFDLRVYAYIPAVCFFDLALRSRRSVDLVERVIRLSSVVMLAACGVLVFLIRSGRISVVEALRFVAVGESQDFMISREGLGVRFFYKGFIYLAVGVMFWAARPGWRPKIIAGMAFVLIVLSGTRGLILSVVICLALLTVLIGKRRALTKYLAVGSLVLTLAAAPFLMSFLRGTSAVSSSNKTRLSTIREVEEDVTASSLLWGHGLGIGVPSRPQEMEITFLEIFHKEGLIGVSVWTSLLIGIFWHYASLRRPDQRQAATPFFLGVLIIWIDTFTNPTLNNPIGLSMVFMSLCVLRFLHESSRAQRTEDACSI